MSDMESLRDYQVEPKISAPRRNHFVSPTQNNNMKDFLPFKIFNCQALRLW